MSVTKTDDHSIFKRLARRVLRICLYTLFSVFVMSQDYFGLSRASTLAYERIFFEVMAPFYGEEEVRWLWPPTYDLDAPPDERQVPADKWNDDITVLLLDDAALKYKDYTWPVSLGVHAEILRDMYETYKPRAIMIDLLFSDRRRADEEGLEAFIAILKEIQSDPETRVYIAAFNVALDNLMADETSILEELRDVATPVAVSWHEPNGNAGHSLYYPMSEGGGARMSVPEGFEVGDPGPAYVMYRDLCEAASGAGKAAMHCPPKGAFEDAFRYPMTIFWGAQGPYLNWEQSNRSSRFNCRAVSETVWQRVLALVAANLFEESDEVPQDCPYTQMVRVRDFVDPVFRSAPDVVPAYEQALGGGTADKPKIVFYGADLRGVEDRIDTYTHGRVAGVYAHAMALDNLMTFGDKYIRYDGDPVVKLIVDIVLTVLVVTISILISDQRAVWFAPTQDGGQTTRSFLFKLPPFVIVWGSNTLAISPLLVGGIFVSVYVLSLAPANWVGYLGAMGIVRTVESERVERFLKTHMPRWYAS